MLSERQRLGELGERTAARWLELRGWTVLDRRFRSGHRDIDLVVAREESGGGRLVAFVEVRTRVSTAHGTPAETVRWRKQCELGRAARAWLRLNRRSGDSYRFDVVGILVEGEGRGVRIQYVEDAFWLRPFG